MTPPKQFLTSVEFIQLKGLKNLKFSFGNKKVTAIFGTNGCGKSTILHALACLYRPVSCIGEKNYFTRFFKKENKVNWTGSKLVAHLTQNNLSKIVQHEKKRDRWTPRINKRPQRDVVYVGISSCVPDIENATITTSSFHMGEEETVKTRNEIIASASNILNFDYEDYHKAICKNKKYKKVRRNSVINYSSLSMGAGEQRLFSLLETLYSMPPESLLLIDELDLTLHTLALKKLVREMVKVANKKNLQIVFTTHREELAFEKNINIRHIWNASDGSQTFVLDHTTPDCLSRLTGESGKIIEIYVEDQLAEYIVREVVRNNNLLQYTSIHRFGAVRNAFVVAAALDIQGDNSENSLFVLDGDCYRTEEKRLQQMEQLYTGTEKDKKERRQKALSKIKQLSLPENEHPEHYLWTKLKDTDNDLSSYAKEIVIARDKHGYLEEILEKSGESREGFYTRLTHILSKLDFWQEYVHELNDWLLERKKVLGI